MASRERERAADWFRRFADAEGRESPRYRDWALGIAGDDTILDKIVRLPVAKRQPVLLLTCARVAGVPLRPYTSIRDDLLARWTTIARLARDHATQTNDPRRCSPLLVALNRIRGPIALIEVGASAGLTLIPDLYSYRWTARGRTIEADPKTGRSPATLFADVVGWGASPPRLPSVVHREGIDLNPLDVTVTNDRTWLEALVWPEQHERLDLVRHAADIVGTVRPRLTQGDALDEIRAAVARARRAAPRATVVIWSPAVLVYLDPDRRAEFQRYCLRASVRWVSLDGASVLPGLREKSHDAGIEADFVLTLDGQPIASVDPLGRSMRVINESGLTPDELDLVEFERVHWGASRSKESLVREHFGLPLVRYYQRLYPIMESAAARRYDPVLVRAFVEARRSGQPRRRRE